MAFKFNVLTGQFDLSSTSSGFAVDANVVHKTGDETIADIKTFTSNPVVPTSAFPETAVANLTTDLAAKALDSGVVHLTGNETIAGTKTFSNSLVVGTGGTNPFSLFGASQVIHAPTSLDLLYSGLATTTTSGVARAALLVTQFNGTSASSARISGLTGLGGTSISSTGNLTSVAPSGGAGLVGVLGRARHEGSGLVTRAAGVAAQVDGGGNITDAVGFLACIPSSTGTNGSFASFWALGDGDTTITGARYGLRVDTMSSGSPKWGVYVQTDPTYLGGAVSFGNVVSTNQNLGTAYNQDVAKSADFTATTAERGKVYQITTGASALTVTLPSVGTAASYFWLFRKTDAGAGAVTVNGAKIMTQGHTVLVWSDGTTYFNRFFGGSLNSSGDYTLTVGGSIFLSPSTGAVSPAFNNTSSLGDGSHRWTTLYAADLNMTNPVAATYGGTGRSTFAVGDLLIGAAGPSWGLLPDVATGSVLVSGGVTTAPAWSSAPTFAGTNLTGTAASLTAGNATKWTTGRTIALTGDVTYTSGSLDGSGNVTGTATLANIPAISGANLTGLTAANITASTTAGRAILNVTNPSAISFVKIAADNSVSTRTPAQVLSDIGAQASGSYAASGANSDITSLSGVTGITGGAGNMTITSGTGNSRTMALRTTTSGGTATTALTLGADQSATFAGHVSIEGVTSTGATGTGKLVFDTNPTLGNIATGNVTAGSASFIQAGSGGLFLNSGSNYVGFSTYAVKLFGLLSDWEIGWKSTTTGDGTVTTGLDTTLSRNAAGIVQFGTTTTNAAGSWMATNGTLSGTLGVGADTTVTSGNVIVATAGKGLQVKGGTNAKIGSGTLTAGTVTISTTAVTANSRIFLTDTSTGSLVNVGSLVVSTKTAGSGFVVTSTNALDASTFDWMIVEQN